MATTIEYPLYNVCYQRTDGREKTLQEEVSLKQGIEAMKRFDKMYSKNSRLLIDVDYLFLRPINKTRITEK